MPGVWNRDLHQGLPYEIQSAWQAYECLAVFISHLLVIFKMLWRLVPSSLLSPEIFPCSCSPSFFAPELPVLLSGWVVFTSPAGVAEMVTAPAASPQQQFLPMQQRAGGLLGYLSAS